MAITILTICGAGVGTSEILRVTVRRALQRLGIDAEVVATDVAHVQQHGQDAQVILATSDRLGSIGPTTADVVVIDNILDQAEVEAKLADALD